MKGHSGDRWNDKADELANLGSIGDVCEAGRYARLSGVGSKKVVAASVSARKREFVSRSDYEEEDEGSSSRNSSGIILRRGGSSYLHLTIKEGGEGEDDDEPRFDDDVVFLKRQRLECKRDE